MLTGIILAGGDHKRMGGENRALLPIYGELLIQKQIREMEAICEEIIIVTNEPKPFLRIVDVSVRIITDFVRGKGPLGGLHAGLSLAEHDEAWVVGCGMPSISAQAARFLQQMRKESKLDAVVPLIGGRLGMLHSIYHTSVANQTLSLLNTGEYRLEQLLDHIRWSKLDSDQFAVRGIETRFTQTIGTMEEYHQYLSHYHDGLEMAEKHHFLE